MDEKTVDLTHVRRTSDGRLMASAIDVGECGACPFLHVDLVGQDGKVYATAILNDRIVHRIMDQMNDWLDSKQSTKRTN